MDAAEFVRRVGAIRARFLEGLPKTGDEAEVRAYAARFVGRKGELTEAMKLLGGLAPDDRREGGRKINETKDAIEAAVASAIEVVRGAARSKDLAAAKIDVSLPGRGPRPGSLHPLTRTLAEILDVFAELGFAVAEGPEIELDDINFTKLGIPPDHPARDMQDTFYVSDEVVLRTHTSPVQIRTMLAQKPPIAIVAPGAVYRCDDDVTHSPQFLQIEGLLVDADVSFADLKGTLTHFARRVFAPEVRVRFRPSYFQFTEPSAEMDIGCIFCRGRDPACRVCKGTGFLEILGCGLVDPVVFENVGYDPETVSGYAFGMGVERIAMLVHGIHDIRLFYENDVRFLAQFAKAPR